MLVVQLWKVEIWHINLLSFQFFSPIQPVRVNFEFGTNGRPSGEANVDFATHQEAMEAMKKHKSNMRKYKKDIS